MSDKKQRSKYKRIGRCEQLENRQMLAVAAPTNLDLLDVSDSGLHNDDNITNHLVLAFGVEAELGATVQLLANGEVVGETVADGSNIIEASHGLPGGVYSFTAIALKDGETSLPSAPVSVTIDVDGPRDVTFNPFDGQEEVLPRQLVAAIFSEPIAVGSFVNDVFVPSLTDAFRLSSGLLPINSRTVLDEPATTLYLVPNANLPGNSRLTATLDRTKIFDLAGNEALPLPSTTFNTVNDLGITGTSVVGFVYDSAQNGGQDVPLAGATVRLVNDPSIETTTDTDGRFQLDNVPSGRLLIDVLGTTIPTAAGTFYPNVDEGIHAIPGQTVTFAHAVYLPLLQTSSFVTLDAQNPTVVTNPNLPGWSLTVPAGSIQRRDGSLGTQMLLDSVPVDRLPGPLPDGFNPSMVLTIQTQGGADVFTSPLALTGPNVDNLAPGEKTVLWDFDHAAGEFVPVATGTVSEDGQTLTTDPGQGALRPGWHVWTRKAKVLVARAAQYVARKDWYHVLLCTARVAVDAAVLTTDFTQFFPGWGGVVAGLVNAVGGQLSNVLDDASTGADLGAAARDWGAASLGVIGQGAESEASQIARGIDLAGDSGRAAQAAELPGLAKMSAFNEIFNDLQSARTAQIWGARIGALGTVFSFYNAVTSMEDHLKALGRSMMCMTEAIGDPPGDQNHLLLTQLGRAIDAINSVNLREYDRAVSEFLFGAAESTAVLRAIGSFPDNQTIDEPFRQQMLLKAKVAESHFRSSLDHLNGLLGRLGNARGVIESMLKTIAPDVTNRVYARFDSFNGETQFMSGIGQIKTQLTPGVQGTLTLAEPINGLIGTIDVEVPELTTGNFEFELPPAVLEKSREPDLDGNGLPDDLDIVLQTPTRDEVDQLKLGLQPASTAAAVTGVIARNATSPQDLVANDSLVYIADGLQGLRVIDISAPSSPNEIGQIQTARSADRVFYRGDRVAVAEASGFIELFDVSDPTVPAKLLQVNRPDADDSRTVLTANHVVFVAAGNVETRNASTGQFTNNLSLVGTGLARDVFITNDTVYVLLEHGVTGQLTLDSYGVDASGLITALDSIPLNGRGSAVLRPTRLSGGDGTLYVAGVETGIGAPLGFVTVNISDPANMVIVGTQTPQDVAALASDGSGNALAVQVVTQSDIRAAHFDVSDPTVTDNLVNADSIFAGSQSAVAIDGPLGIIGGGRELNIIRFVEPGQTADTVAPTVSFTNAIGGTLFTETERIGVNVAASDNVQIARVELLAQEDNVIATDTSFPFDMDLLFPDNLPDGQPMILAVRATDSSGNTATATVNLTYRAVPPTVVGVSPAVGSQIQTLVNTIQVDASKPLDRATASPADFTIVGDGSDNTFGTADDVTITPVRLSFAIDNQSVSVITQDPLPSDHYRFTAPAASLTDSGGNQLDGEFGGTFPSGNGTAGGDFSFGFDVLVDTPSLGPLATYLTEVIGTKTLTIDNGDIVVRDSSLNDIVRRDTDTIQSLFIGGTGGNDILEIDFTNGSPLLPGGTLFNDHNPNDNDTLQLTGGTFTNIEHTYRNANDGRVGLDGQFADYIGIEPIIDLLQATDRVFSFNDTNNNITLGDNGIANDGISRITSADSEQTDFVDPSGTITINSGNGDNIITLAEDGFTASTLPQINGQLGTNTLRFGGSGSMIDFTDAGAVLPTNLQEIDFRGDGSNALILNVASVNTITNAANQLVVHRDTNDDVRIGAGWTAAGVQSVNGDRFQTWTQGGTMLLVSATDTIGVHRSSSGSFYRDANGNGHYDGLGIDNFVNLGASTDLPAIGDWNGDGISDLGLFRQATGTFLLDLNGNGTWDGPTIDRATQFGGSNDVPVIGDWNGDGRDEIGVHRPASRLFHLDENGNGEWNMFVDRLITFGNTTDIGIAGDWNGDGRDDIGVFRAGEFLRDQNGNGQWDGLVIDRSDGFGSVTDTPVIGDWNADGRDDIGVHRGSNGMFLRDTNGNGGWDGPLVDTVNMFGGLGDTPLAGNWAGEATLMAMFGGADDSLHVTAIVPSDLTEVVSVATDLWRNTGLTSSQLHQLTSIDVSIANLAGARLGQTIGNSITIDSNAANYGWFVDATPADNGEFGLVGSEGLLAVGDSAAAGRMDLLTVVLHEIGHVLGRDDQFSGEAQSNVMQDALDMGRRRFVGYSLVASA